MTPGKPSTTSQGASATRHGSDPVLALMKRYGIPVTRENYIEMAYLDENRKLGPEEEANLPSSLRRQE